MKKLILSLLLIGLPCQAGQFKEFDGEILNKQLINYVKMGPECIIINYPGYGLYHKIIVKDKTKRIEKYNEIKKWLMECEK